MFSGLFGSATRVGDLRWSLDDSARTHKAIAGRVAGALEASGGADFSDAMAARQGKSAKVDLEVEMVNLASTQLRYDASAKLLQQAYQGLRTAIKDRG